jgi:hypothetical protein
MKNGVMKNNNNVKIICKRRNVCVIIMKEKPIIMWK